jgi:hypothetical protein
VQVRDPTTPAAAELGRSGSGPIPPAAARPRRARGFARVVEARGQLGGWAPAAAGSGEAPRAAAAPRPAPAPLAAIGRVLLGGGTDRAEARIQILAPGGGAVEIRLASAADGRAIALQILTATAGSRDTLSVVMTEVRLRLRRRGIALTEAATGEPRP